VEVTDTGCGISAEERDLVFDEFFRGGARTASGEGRDSATRVPWPGREARLSGWSSAWAMRRTIDRPSIVLAARRRAGGVRVEVTDTGCGISAEERDLVFDECRGRAERRG
jgi:signal transduction histidine kinase